MTNLSKNNSENTYSKSIKITEGWKVIISMIGIVAGATALGFGVDIKSVAIGCLGGSLCLTSIVSAITTAVKYYET